MDRSVRLNAGVSLKMEVIADICLCQAEISEEDARKYAMATGTDLAIWLDKASRLDVLAVIGKYAQAQAIRNREAAARKGS